MRFAWRNSYISSQICKRSIWKNASGWIRAGCRYQKPSRIFQVFMICMRIIINEADIFQNLYSGSIDWNNYSIRLVTVMLASNGNSLLVDCWIGIRLVWKHWNFPVTQKIIHKKFCFEPSIGFIGFSRFWFISLMTKHL